MKDASTEQIIRDHEVADLRKELANMFTYFKEQLGAILEQTTKTNGRVTKLEQWQIEIQTTVRMLRYVAGILVTLLFTVTGIALSMWSDWRNNKEAIRTVVREQLTQFVLEEQNK